MALEDALVLAETLSADQTVVQAVAGYVQRRIGPGDVGAGADPSPRPHEKPAPGRP